MSGQSGCAGASPLVARRIAVVACLLGACAAVGSAGAASAGAASVAATPFTVLSAAQEQMVPAKVGQSSLSLPADRAVVLPMAQPVGPVVDSGVTPAPVFSGATRVPSLDSEYGYGYRLASGAPMEVLYASPVNYQTANGGWAPIDATLRANGSGGYENTAGAFQVSLPASWSSAAPVSVVRGGVGLSWSVAGMAPTTGSVAGVVASYPNVLPGTSVTYASSAVGLGEVVSFANLAAATSSLTYQVQATGGGTLATGQDGSLVLSDAAGNVMWTIPAPVATDSSVGAVTGGGSVGSASWSVSGSAPDYQVGLVVDPMWLLGATYPVRVDPGSQINEDASMDSFVDDGYPSTPMASDPSEEAYLKVKDLTGSGADVRRTVLQFPVSGLLSGDPRVLGASVDLWVEAKAGGEWVDLHTLSGGWGESTVDWDNQPAFSSTVYNQQPVPSAGGELTFNATSAYQAIADAGTNDGVGISEAAAGANNGDAFYSSRATGVGSVTPYLSVSYDTITQPVLTEPSSGELIQTDMPTLAVAGPSTNSSSLTLTTNYQIATDANFTQNVINSGPVENGSAWTLPANDALTDGKTYYWRAYADDGYQYGQEYSATQTFTVSVPHFGDDSRWAMWSDSLGNNMQLDVNQATGNLFLNYPLTSVTTPVGPLDVNLSYNSLDGSTSMGLGRGWVVSAGAGADPSQTPVSLARSGLSVDLDTLSLIVTMQDGSRSVYTNLTPNSGKNSAHEWQGGSGADQGTIIEDADAGETNPQTYTLTTNDGSIYTFDADGNVTAAQPVTTDGAKTGLVYTYSGTPEQLQAVTDPLGRTVGFSYTSGDLTQVKFTGGSNSAVWTVGWTSGEPTSITDATGSRTVTFGYTTESTGSGGDGATYLTSVGDAGGNTWNISYANPNYSQPGVSAPMMQVASVQDPGNYTTATGGSAREPATTFSYGGELAGYVVKNTTVTPPNGNTGGSPSAAFQTVTSFDTMGYPVMIQGPAESISPTQPSVHPTTTMQWDTNGNQECERSPAENQAYADANSGAYGCVIGNLYPDQYETTYQYQENAPFAMTQKQAPLQLPTTNGTNPTWTYTYDAGLTGLLQQNYQGISFVGMPQATEIQQNNPLSQDWGSTPPDGLSAGAWAVRWTGRLHVATQGTYNFKVKFDGGVRLIVAGKVLLNCFDTKDWTTSDYNCGQDAPVHVEMWPANPLVILEYHHYSGDTGYVDTQWDAAQGGAYSELAGTLFDPNLNLLTSETTPQNLTTTWDYSTLSLQARDLYGSVTQTDNTQSPAVTRTTSYSYDDYGRITSETRGAGSGAAVTTTTSYDPASGCAQTIVSGQSANTTGTTTTNQCDYLGNVTESTTTVPPVAGTRQTTEQDQATKTWYNSDEIPYKTQQVGDSGTTTTVYYPNLRTKSVTDPLGHETLYTYDARGDVLTKTVNAQDAPNSEVTTYTYDADGNQLSKTVSYKTTSATWTSTYDALDRIATMQAPGVANPTTYAYDQVGQLVQGDPGFLTSAVTTPDGVQTTTTENYRGDVVDTQRGTQGTPLAPTTTKYDAADRATSITDPNGNTVSYTYDGWGDKLSETSPSGATSYTTPLQAGASVVTAYAYDAVGNLASTSVDAKNTPYTQTYTYDGLGDVLSTTAPAPTTGTATWNFTYDAAGQQVEQTDPNGHATDETYNQLGQLASTTTYPSSSLTLTTTYAYDADGNLSEKTPPATDTPAAPSQCFTYDEYNNLASRYTVPNGDACTYAPQLNTDAYTTNPISGTTSAVDTPTGQTTTITYDPQNPTRVSQVAENGATSAYTYDPNSGLLATSTQTLGSTSNQTSYTYDAYGRIQAITDPFTNKQTSYTYTPANQVATVTQPTGLVTTYAYDTAERLLSETTKNGAATVLEYGQNYNDFSQVTELDETYPTIAGQTQSGDYAYQYNPAQELSQAKYTPSGGSTQTTNYAYDLAGNRTQVAVVGGTTTNYTYDHADRLTTDGTNTYTWNALDQMTAAGSTSYTYTPWGSLTSATTPSQTITYTPDALNRTTTRAVQGGQTTTYTYDGTSNTTTSQQVGSGTPTYYAPGLSAPLAQQNGTTTRFYQQDIHGDLTLFTDPSGNPTASIRYDPWGMPTALGSDATQSLLSYQSQPTDPTTGLVQMSARAYNPTLGQFTTQDTLTGSPVDPLTLNQYIYAGDSPIDNQDPSGHLACADQSCRYGYEPGTWSGSARHNHQVNQQIASNQAEESSPTAARWAAIATAVLAAPQRKEAVSAAYNVGSGCNRWCDAGAFGFLDGSYTALTSQNSLYQSMLRDAGFGGSTELLAGLRSGAEGGAFLSVAIEAGSQLDGSCPNCSMGTRVDKLVTAGIDGAVGGAAGVAVAAGCTTLSAGVGAGACAVGGVIVATAVSTAIQPVVSVAVSDVSAGITSGADDVVGDLGL